MNALLAFEWPFSETVVERFGWVLVHSLWQFALVALFAGTARRAMRRSSSAARYGVLVVSMAVMVLGPVATWLFPPSDALDHLASRGQDSSAASSPGADTTRLADNPISAGDTEVDGPTPGLAASSIASEPLSAVSPLSADTQLKPSWSEWAKAVLRPWLAWIVVGWSLGVVMCSLRPLLGWHTLRRLRRVGVSAVSDDVLAAMCRVSERLGLCHAVRVLQSTLAQVPVVVGYFRPVILLPVSLVTSIPAAQLEAILAHELAHVRRHDFVVNLLQTLIETIFFYHPAVWWLSRQIRVEREHCCDDLVVASLGNRVEYGRALLAIEELRGQSTVLALGAADGSLLSRVRRIVGFNSDRAADSQSAAVRLSDRWPVALLSLMFFGVAFVLSMSWNLAAKDDGAKESQPTIAKLPDDVTVELIGVGFHPSRDRDWWKADGSKLEQRPHLEGGFSVMSNSPEQAQCREFLIQIRGLPREHSVSTDYGVNAATGSSYSDGLWVGEHGAGPFKSKTTSIRVGLTTEPYGPTVTIDVTGRKPSVVEMPEELKPLYDRVAPLGVEESTGQTELLLVGPSLNELYKLAAWELHAIDVDGQKHRSSSQSVPVSGEKHFVFKLSRDRLARFEYRLRPYRHWVTFENVSLQPGKLADVKVKVDSLAPERAAVGLKPELGLGQRLDLVQWSHDSKQVFATGDFNKLTLWEHKDAGWAPTSLDAHHHANSIMASRKSPLIVVGTNVGTAEVWDATTRKRESELRSSPEYSVYAVAISSDDKLVAACGTNGTVHVFDRELQKPTAVLGEKADTRMASLAFSPNDKRLAAMDRYGHLVLWSLPDGARLAEWKDIAGEDCSVQWSPDGKQLAISGWGRVTLISAAKRSQPRIIQAPESVLSRNPETDESDFSGPQPGGIKFASVTAIAPDLRTVASVAPDASIGIWELATRRIVQKLPAPKQVAIMDSQSAGLRHLTFSPDGQRLTCTTLRGDVVFWQLAQGEAKGALRSEDRRGQETRQELKTEDLFARKVSLTAQAMPLKEALAEVARAAKVELQLDVDALKQVDLDVEQPVTVTIKDEPLSEALGRLIKWQQHYGAFHQLRGGKLVITTLQAHQAEIERHLPQWLKPHYNHGLLATLDDDHNVVSITAGEAMTDELLGRLKTLPKLRELYIETTKLLTPAGLDHLAELSSLQKLSLYSLSHNGMGLGDASIQRIVGLKSLRELSLGTCGTTDAGVRLLEGMPQLTHLSLNSEGRLTDAALASIGTLKRLKHLGLSSYVATAELGRMRFTEAGIRRLSGLQELEELHLVGHAVPADALVFPRLKSLSLGLAGMDDACAARIAECRHLQSLDLVYTNITDAGLKKIAELRALSRLNLDSHVVTDAGIEHLKSLTKLEHLSLRASRLTDESLRHLAEIKTLARVDLHGSGEPGTNVGECFTIAGVQQLKALPNLRTLWLTNFHSPGGYLGLQELAQLRELSLMMTNLREEELDTLEEALPNTTIHRATGGGYVRVSKKLRTRARAEQPIAPNGEIVGQLIDNASGKPVAGAVVACGAVINDSLQGGGANAVTDAEGHYRLQPPSPGIYNVWLKQYDKEPSMTAAADDGILVEAGKVAASQMRLVLGRKVTGKVVDADDKPFANQSVNCYSAARPLSGGIQSVTTKDDGTFEFALPPGRAYVYTQERTTKTPDNPFGTLRSASVHIEVPETGDTPPITLTLQKHESKFGDPEWLKRSTPGTQIVRREGNEDVTGIVVDEAGEPIEDAKVFRYDGPLVPTNDKGEFRIKSMKGTQFVMHAFVPGYHVWTGTPTSGDVLKIVLEKKAKTQRAAKNDAAATIRANASKTVAAVTSRETQAKGGKPGASSFTTPDWEIFLRCCLSCTRPSADRPVRAGRTGGRVALA